MSSPPTTSQVQGPAIHVQGLEKSYKELRVVVKILSTLLRADAGTARVNGFDVGSQAAEDASRSV